MACEHPSIPGYAFCGECGEPTDRRRCLCGFAPARRDRFCGQCGRNLEAAVDQVGGDGSGASATHSRSLPDLARLAAQAAADRGIAAPERKSKLSQSEIREMLAQRRKGN